MERVSRLIVIASIVLAGAAHAWLAIWHPALPAAAAAAFAITFVLAQFSTTLALVVVFGTMYLAPALLYAAFDSNDHHLLLVWLAALAGPVLANANPTRWHLPQQWTIPFAGWALVLAVTWPIIAARELDFSRIALTTYDTANAMFGAPPRVAAAWIAIVALAQMLGILFIDFLFAHFKTDLRRAERTVIFPIVASVSAGAVAGLYQALLDINWMNAGVWPRQERAVGFVLDANTFGIGCAIWAPVAMVAAWRLGWSAWTGAALFVLLATGMWTSGSRTALLALSAGTAGLVVAFAQRKGIWQPKMAPIVLLLGGAILILAMAIAPRGGNSPSPLQRVFDRLPRLEAAELQRFADEMWTRFGYGHAATLMIRDHPVTGVGIGAFHIVGTDYAYRATGKTLPSDNAQNWWRHQVAELGFAGAVPSLWLSLVIVALVWRGGPYAEPFGATTVLRMVLVGIGLASLLGVPTQHPATWISFAILAFWLLTLYSTAEGGEISASAEKGPSRGWWIAAFAVALVTLTGQIASGRDDLRVPVRAFRDGIPYKYGFTPPEGMSQFGELRWVAARAVAVIPVEQRWYQLAVWAPQPDIASKPVTLQVVLNDRRVIQQPISSPEPLTYFLQMPADARWAILELRASRSAGEGRALRIAHQWQHELPPHVPRERVIR